MYDTINVFFVLAAMPTKAPCSSVIVVCSFNFQTTRPPVTSATGYLPSTPQITADYPSTFAELYSYCDYEKGLTDERLQHLFALLHSSTLTGLRNYVMMLTLLDTGIRLKKLANLQI